tara:strand:- start:57 stop:800 length:744 start_codon:yes stop_codon:yes gene_type:complete
MINRKHTIAILAFNNHKLTIMNLNLLIKLGYKENILLFDNGSKPSYKEICKNLNIQYISEKKNIYVNPAWNKIFDIVKSNYLTLLNNDCFILSDNYFNEVINHMENNNIIISSCKTYNRKKMTEKKLKLSYQYYNFIQSKKLKYVTKARRQGWIMTINLNIYKTLSYKIPDYIKVWFGDDWIWSQIVKNHFKYAIYKNRYAVHIKSTTTSNEKIKKLINEDIKMLEKSEDWIEKSIHQKSRFLHRYI